MVAKQLLMVNPSYLIMVGSCFMLLRYNYQLSLVLGAEVCPYFRDLAYLEAKIIRQGVCPAPS